MAERRTLSEFFTEHIRNDQHHYLVEIDTQVIERVRTKLTRSHRRVLMYIAGQIHRLAWWRTKSAACAAGSPHRALSLL